MKDKKRIMMIRPGKRFQRQSFGQPLGLLSLISILRKYFSDLFEVQLVEQALYDLSVEEVRQKMLEFEPDLVLFSCLSVEANELHELTRTSKSLFPEVPVWVGGPHASVFYDWELETGSVDAVCIGEGEETFREMIQSWLDGQPLDNVAGLALIRGNEVVTTPPRLPIEDLDSLPLPAWDMIDLDLYARQVNMQGFAHSLPWAMLFTSRACPFQCLYCHNVFGKKVKTRSIEHVLRELELLVNQFGVKEIHIIDDIFNLDLARAKAICDEIISRGIKIKIAFPNGLRADRMDRELIKKLKAAGCYTITYAVETASPRLQKAIRKNLDLEKTREVIAWTDEEGLITQAFFMLGFPGETIEEMEMTIEFAKNSRLTRGHFFTVVVYPRMGLYEMAKQEYPDFDLSGYDCFNLRYFAETPLYTMVTGIDLFKIQRRAYRTFFLRAHLIAKLLIRFPKNRLFFQVMFWGLRTIITSLSKVEIQYLSVKNWIRRVSDRRKVSKSAIT